MANPSKRPTPAARLTELMAYEKRRLLRGKQRRGEPAVVTAAEFDEAWAECWQIMVKEKAWPHLTPERKGWRAAQQDMRPMMLRMWLGETTSFDIAVDGLRGRAERRSAGAAGPGGMDGLLVG